MLLASPLPAEQMTADTKEKEIDQQEAKLDAGEGVKRKGPAESEEPAKVQVVADGSQDPKPKPRKGRAKYDEPPEEDEEESESEDDDEDEEFEDDDASVEDELEELSEPEVVERVRPRRKVDYKKIQEELKAEEAEDDDSEFKITKASK